MGSGAGEELCGPDGLVASAAIRQLDAALLEHGLHLREAEPRAIERTFLDTFDGRLRAAGIAAVRTREEGGSRLSVLDADTGAERAGEPAGPASNGDRLLPLELAPGPVRAALLPAVDVRVLLPLVTLHSELSEPVVLDDEEKIVTWLSFESAHVPRAAAEARRLALRLRVAPLRGYGAELATVSEAARGLGFVVPRHRLPDEAVLAAGRSPGGTSSRVKVELLAAQRSDAAAAAVLRRLREVIEDNLPGTIEDLDAEFLHDLRVAVRRTRAVLRELRAVFPATELGQFRDEFRWLQQVTGPARDLDVYVLGWDELTRLAGDGSEVDLAPVLAVLRERRSGARAELVSALRSERATRLLRDWDAFLEELVERPLAGREAAERPIGELAGERIARVYKRIVTLGTAIGADSPAESLHEVRKKGKELRYLLELFGGPLFPREVVAPMVKRLKALQDVLGRHQDREVQSGTLREVAEHVARRPGHAGALLATGVLLDRLHDDELAARADFAERFAAFAEKPMRRQVRETFR